MTDTPLSDDVVERVAEALEEEFFAECAFDSRQAARAALEAARYGEMVEALVEFVERVERGEVRSVKTYNKFKTILSSIGASHES